MALLYLRHLQRRDDPRADGNYAQVGQGRWFSLAYSLATALFGGFTPAMSTALIKVTGDKAAPGYWMSFAAICALLATLYLYQRVSRQALKTQNSLG